MDIIENDMKRTSVFKEDAGDLVLRKLKIRENDPK